MYKGKPAISVAIINDLSFASDRHWPDRQATDAWDSGQPYLSSLRSMIPTKNQEDHP
jgi:hypothetical protein